MELLISGGELVLETGMIRADLLIEGGTIAGIISPNSKVPAECRLEADGLVVLPGLVDVHTHLRDPGYTHKEDFETGTAAAAAGGFTTVVAQPNTDPPIVTVAALQSAKAIGASAAHVDFGISALAEPGHAQDLLDLRRHGALLFDAARADAPEASRAADPAALCTLMQAAASTGAPFAVYATDQSLIDLFTAAAKSTDLHDLAAFAAGRPAVTETVGIAMVVELARATEARVLIRQISTAAALACIKHGRSVEGIDLWAEVNPHHLFLNDRDATALGWRGKVIPPLREESDVEALWSGLSDGTLDLIGTDHAPHLISERRGGDLSSIPAGLPALETALPLLLNAVAAGRTTFVEVAKWLSLAPARFAHLYPRKGTLLPGSDADIVLADPEDRWTISDEHLLTRAGWTPFDKRQIQGRVVATLVRGRAVYREGDMLVQPGYGDFLHPKEFRVFMA